MSSYKTNVRNYTDNELLNKVSSLPNFFGFPEDYWILGVQSNEDEFNVFDDKFYLFKGTDFIMVLTGTTNAGLTGLKGYENYNSNGCAIIQTGLWYYDMWKPGLHRGKMKALVQNGDVHYYRDWNKNQKAEEMGKMYVGNIGINFHTVIYGKYSGFIRRIIGGWSTGCQVANNVSEYYRALNIIGNQKTVTYCLIKEF